MYVKSQMHFHNGTDLKDTFIGYSPYEAIDFAYSRGFKIISFTNHDTLYYTRELRDYALSKGIILINGIELSIHKKHVLIYNPCEDVLKIKTFEDLRKYKNSRKNILVVAPHPFYGARFCLKKKLFENKDIFDALEYSSLYTKRTFRRANKKVLEFCKLYNKPMIANGDVHHLDFLENTYSMINVDFDINDLEVSKFDHYINNIFDNIKANNIEIVSKPLGTKQIIVNHFFFAKGYIRKVIKKTSKILIK